MGRNLEDIVHRTAHVGWERVILMAVTGTVLNLVLDQFGFFDWVIGLIPGGDW